MKEIIVSTLVIILLLVVITLQLLLAPGGNPGGPAPEQLRSYAAALEAQGLYKQAVQEYQNYLEQAQIPPEQRANLLYTIGNLRLEQLQDYENALAAYLQISTLYPQLEISREAEKKMVVCLEHLERSFDAQRKLKQMTDLKATGEEPGTGPVVAQIGDRTITLDQIERELAQLPKQIQWQYSSPEKKLEYLQSKIFTELLAERAVRKEYDQDPQIRKQVNELEKSLLANRILQEEVRDQVKVTPSDVELYFQAHPEEFSQPEARLLAHILVDTATAARQVQQELEGGMTFEQAVETYSLDNKTKSRQGLLGFVTANRDMIPGIGENPEMTKQLLNLTEGQISEPLQSDQGYHIFKAVQARAAVTPTLEEVRDKVETQVRALKEQELQKDLMQRLLSSEKVKINQQPLQAVQDPAAITQ